MFGAAIAPLNITIKTERKNVKNDNHMDSDRTKLKGTHEKEISGERTSSTSHIRRERDARIENGI